MSSSAITYLLLDAQNDPVFDPNAQLVNAAAVQQAILTRLKLFFGEWWEDLQLGLPVFQSILGQASTQKSQAAMNLAIQKQIAGVPYVTAVTDINSSFEAGKFSFTATAQTSFGTVTVSNLPGANASLGG